MPQRSTSSRRVEGGSEGGCADVNIVNSCIVTQRASYQTRQAIRKVIKESPSATTAVIGCYAQVFPEELSGIKGVSHVVGNTMKSRVPEMLLDSHPPCPPLLNIPPFSKGGNGGISHARSFFDKDTPFEELSAPILSGRTRGFLKIQDGVIPFAAIASSPLRGDISGASILKRRSPRSSYLPTRDTRRSY